MEKRCLIIEDNFLQRETIKQLIKETSANIRVYDVDNLLGAYKVLLENVIDLFIVDIVLDTAKKGDTSGVKLVNIIRTMPQYMFTPVIFVTSLEDPKMFAYSKLHCFSYLEKPFSYGEAKEIFKSALGYTSPRSENDVLCLRKDGALYPFRIDQIAYIESVNRHLTIHKTNGDSVQMPYMTCKRILEEANNTSLFQCTRGVIVNRDCIKAVDRTNCVLELKGSKRHLDIGGTYAKQVLLDLADWP